MSCLTVTREIRELTNKFPGEIEESIKTLVGIWQEDNNKSINEYPTAQELNELKTKLRQLIQVNKIISGGQSGIDTLGLKVAKRLGIKTGGTAPKGFLREKGFDSEDIASYGLVEITDTEQEDYTRRTGRKDPYTGRTELNVRNSDGTVYFSTQEDSAGKIATMRAAKEWNKPFILNPTTGQLISWLIENNIRTLNIAGNRGSKAANILSTVENTLINTLSLKETSAITENAKAFYTPIVSSVEEQAKADLDFDPRTRRDRVSLIARFFSKEIDKSLIETDRYLTKSLEEAIDDKAKENIKRQISNLDRIFIIDKHKPAGLFERVKQIFQDYINDSEENRIAAELADINAKDKLGKFSQEEKYAAARRRASKKFMEYSKIVDNFMVLAEEASTILMTTEHVRIDPNYQKTKEVNTNEDDPNGESIIDENNAMSNEETVKDGWMTNYKHVSSHESLSQAVRAVINQVPRLDYKGKVERDDIGFIRYLDADYVHATLIDGLGNMITAQDMIPLLTEKSRRKPWVKQIIRILENDETLFSQFYQDFRKDFMPYWIQKKKTLPDGTYKMQTISVNTPEGVYYLLDAWRDNYENGLLLDDDSVYDKNGELNIENANKGLKWVETLTNKFNNLTSEERVALLEQDKICNTIIKLLNMIGIDPNQSVLKTALTDIKSNEVVRYTDPIMLLLPELNVIYSGIIKGKIKSETLEDGTEVRGDLINTFGSAYNSIALMMAEVTEDAIESSVRENDKSYYSHLTPSYLGKMIKQLKNVMQDDARFQSFMESEFKQYEWFYKDGQWRNDWLQQLEESEEMRNGLKHKTVLNSDKVEYTNWDDLDYTLALLTEYWGDPDDSRASIKWAWYHVPILSDAPSAEFIRFRKYVNGVEFDEEGNKLTYDQIITSKLTNLVIQEYDRIMLVRARDAAMQNGDTSISPIANYDISRDKNGNITSMGGAEFKFLPELNKIKYDNGETFLDRVIRLVNDKTKDGSELKSTIETAIADIMRDGFEETFTEWKNIGLLDTVDSGKYKYLPFKSEKTAKEALREYYWNSKLATSQIIQISTTDLAFYKNVEDFQKRYKEVHAPSLRLNTSATYNGERIGREWERTIYLKDSEIVSSVLSDIEEVIVAKYNAGELTEYNAASILSKFGYSNHTITTKNGKEKKYAKVGSTMVETAYVNVADAQAYRSLSSYKAIMVMSGQWTEDMERAYNNFKNGIWDYADFDTIWQTKKPYVYTQVNNTSGITNHTGIKTPVQHKNSEFLLLAMHELVAGPLKKSGKLAAINQFMEENNIDVVQFESTTKVGKQGVINLEKVSSKKDVLDYLGKVTGIAYGNENPNIVHRVSYEDYGIQTATPEHVIDTIQLVGTQIRKLITADISDSKNTKIEVDGKKLSKKEWLDLYNAINTENILQAFIEVDEIFKDPKEVEKALLEEVRGNQRYGIDMVRACTLDENGQFNIPLFDPVQSQRVQTLLNSIIKSRITKQKIKGGALIQVSGYGLTDDLNIVFEGEGENKRIKYIECYMPAYSRKFYEPFMKEGTHELDVTKLPDDLRKLIGYRVPTEDKYSMAPLYIKGFLPQMNGSAIMLPAEITTLSGSDFDVDKMYVMIPEFEVKERFNKSQFIKDFKAKYNPEVDWNYLDSTYAEITRKTPFSEGTVEMDMYNFYVENKDKYTTRIIEKVKYDYNKPAHEQSLVARNNALIDMMWGVLTNADTTSKILNPGGFDPQKRAARVVTILQSVSDTKLAKALGVPKDRVISTLLSLDLNSLDAIANKTKKAMDPISPRTQVLLHQQNMTGAKLIGIYANHNANHALIQHTELALSTEYGSFILNGKRLTSLHEIKNREGDFISKNNAGFLAASVDNVKDPVLAFLNQNTFTADASMLLSRLGYSPLEIGLLMSQPIVMEITQQYFRESRNGVGKDTIIENILKKYKQKAGLMQELSYDNYKSNNFLIEDLAKNILIAKDMPSISSAHDTSDYDKVEFYKKQVSVGFLFSRIMKTADALGQLVQATRADTANGAAGPTIADSIIKVQKVTDFIEDVVLEEKSPLVNAYVISEGLEFTGDVNQMKKLFNSSDPLEKNIAIENLRNLFLNSSLPYLQAFYTLGVEKTNDLLRNYFPQYNDSFQDVIDTLRKMTKRGRLNVKTMNSVYNDLLAYIMSGEDFFGTEYNEDGTIIMSSKDRRDAFINDFPSQFKRVVESNPDIASLEFISRLKVIRPNDNNPVETLIFKNVGTLSPTLRERYMRDWASLLHMSNPEAQKLALNLFRYSFYRNGFAFGPNTFIHLAPTAIRKAIPGYIEKLRRLLNTKEDFSMFVDQYIYNHLDNRQLVPEIPDDSSIEFTDTEGNIMDTVNVIITQTSNSSDRKAIKSTTEIAGEKVYDFFEYIGRRIRGNYVYYKLTVSDDTSATYERIDPLGHKNSFLEYEYGRSANEIESVIKPKKVNTVDADSAYASSETPEMSADELERNRQYSEGLSDSSFTDAFELVYGTPVRDEGYNEDDFLSFSPNTDYRDANNEQICRSSSSVIDIATL